jgi:predicted nuclease of predicted toxin-antitoxin system
MRVLLDECIDRRLKPRLPQHEVSTVQELGWAGKRNGELLDLAAGKFEVFVTVDQNLRYQQQLLGRRIAVLILIVPSNTPSSHCCQSWKAPSEAFDRASAFWSSRNAKAPPH